MVAVLILTTALASGVARPVAKATATTNAYGYTWKPLKIGASGWVTGIDISPDGSMRVVRTDVGGAYRWDVGSDRWVQLITARSMPAADRVSSGSFGVFDITSAASDTRRLYLAWRNAIFVSDDAGSTWRKGVDGLPSTLRFDANDDTRFFTDKIAASPANADVALFGSPDDGLFRTADGGRSWSKVATVPAGKRPAATAASPGVTAIEFDPSNPAIVWATSYGNGTFRSTDGGVTFGLVPGAPTGARSAAVGGDGSYVAVGDEDGARSVWRYKAGAWRDITGPALAPTSVTIDPHDPNRLAVMDDGSAGSNVNQSSDAGSTYTSSRWTAIVNPGNDIGHIGDNSTPGGYLGPAQLLFDPSSPNDLWLAMGFGVVRTHAPSSSTTITWETHSRGIEELVAKDVIATPSGSLLTAGMDRGIFLHPNPDAFPDHQRPTKRFNSAWDLDYSAVDPNYVVAVVGDMRHCCFWDNLTIQSGYSTDGGATWTRFPSMPTNPPTSYTWGFGDIAVGAPGNVVWIPTGGGKDPYVTKDGGATWAPITFPGADPNNTLLDYNWFLDRKILTADKATPGTFYVYHAGDAQGNNAGVLRSTDGGSSWTMMRAGQLDVWGPWNAQLEAVPGRAGHLFFTPGPLEPAGSAFGPFRRSTDGGATWSAVPDVLEVSKFAFGAPAHTGGYPAIFIAGYVKNVYGLYRSDDDTATWVKIADFADDSLDEVTTMGADPRAWGKVYVGFSGSGFAYGTPSAGTGASDPVTSPPTPPTPPDLPTTPVATEPPTVPRPAPAPGPEPALLAPQVSPNPVPVTSSLTVSNLHGRPCTASGVYVALFDVGDAASWSLVSSAWVTTSVGTWNAMLPAPTATGSHYTVRAFCGDRTEPDVAVTAVSAPPAIAGTSAPPTTQTVTTTPITAGETVAVSNPPGVLCSEPGGVYVAMFDTTDLSTWTLLSSAWVAPTDGLWHTTIVAPAAAAGRSVRLRVFCGSLPPVDTVVVIAAAPAPTPTTVPPTNPPTTTTVAPPATPLVTPRPVPAGTPMTVSNQPGQPCSANGVYVAIFDTSDPAVWVLVASTWVATSGGNWRAVLASPRRAGTHYLVRAYCGTDAQDAPLGVSTG